MICIAVRTPTRTTFLIAAIVFFCCCVATNDMVVFLLSVWVYVLMLLNLRTGEVVTREERDVKWRYHIIQFWNEGALHLYIPRKPSLSQERAPIIYDPLGKKCRITINGAILMQMHVKHHQKKQLGKNQ